MKMKLLLLFGIALPFAGCSESVKFNVWIRDENGSPVTNATMKMKLLKKRFFGAGSNPCDYRYVTAGSDSNGVIDVKLDMVSDGFRHWITAKGYYDVPLHQVYYRIQSQDLFSLTLAEHEKKESVVMRKVKNPIPMVGYSGHREFMLPNDNRDYGFDMVVGDFLSPLGKGKVTDFLVRKNYDLATKKTKSAIVFNGRGNGAYKIKAFTDSKFRSPYEADTNATFETVFRYEYKTHDYINPKDGSRQTEVCDVNEDDCLVLRTRCRFNDRGELVSCHYSKIYGKIEIFQWFKFRAYAFNPTPNDPNLEFDVSKNLLDKDTSPYLP